MSNVYNIETGKELPPDFITRVDISRMTDPELDQFIERIRLRRMASFVIYQQTEADKQSVREERARAALEKEITMIHKQLDTLDRHFEKLETRIHKLRGLRIQAGLPVL